MLDVTPRLETLHRDTTYHDGFVSITSAFIQIAKVDASGQFCFRDVPPGDYRFEARAMRIDRSSQAIIIHLGGADTLKSITLRYRPYGRSPEEEVVVANMLRALDDNRRRWIASRPAHYLLRIKHECGCFDVDPPKTYEVVNGMAVAVIDSAGRRPLRSGEGVRTIDAMFASLRAALLDEYRYVAPVVYDERFGWPRSYNTGTRDLMTDGWDRVTVERFDVIK